MKKSDVTVIIEVNEVSLAVVSFPVSTEYRQPQAWQAVLME
jgi:hypothetical protein